jgi:hypothetical protein
LVELVETRSLVELVETRSLVELVETRSLVEPVETPVRWSRCFRRYGGLLVAVVDERRGVVAVGGGLRYQSPLAPGFTAV